MEEEETKSDYGKRPLWQWLVLYIAIGLVIYGLVYYFVFAKKGGYNLSSSTSTNPSYASPTQAMTSPTASQNAVKQITVQGSEYAFTPSTITLQKGQPAEITFKNVGQFPHNLSIADLNVKTKTIRPGETDTVQFTPDKTGQFAFICTVPGHADKGMKGTLIVQ